MHCGVSTRVIENQNFMLYVKTVKIKIFYEYGITKKLPVHSFYTLFDDHTV